MDIAAKLRTTTAYSLMQACQDGTLTKAARVDYGMDFHAKADVDDIFKCYQNVLTYAKLSCEDLHQAFLDDQLNERVLARCTDTGLRTKIETAGGIYNHYMYLKDKEAGRPIDDSIERKKEDFVMECIRNSGYPQNEINRSPCLYITFSYASGHRLFPSPTPHTTHNQTFLMSLSPLAQAHVQSCGSSILSLMRCGADLTFDFNNCVFSDCGKGEQEYQCLVCGLTQDKMPACATCHAVPYCSRACQEADWKRQHKYECKTMKKAYNGLKEVGKI
jgi:hypothetical protein